SAVFRFPALFAPVREDLTHRLHFTARLTQILKTAWSARAFCVRLTEIRTRRTAQSLSERLRRRTYLATRAPRPDNLLFTTRDRAEATASSSTAFRMLCSNRA